MERIARSIHKHVSEELLEEDVELTSETPLIAEGILDSIGIIRLVAFLEQTFEIRVPDDDVIPEHFQTIRAIAEYVKERMEKKGMRSA